MAGGLYHTLNIGEQALYVTRQGVDTTSHNIANANTEGYSRQRVNVRARDPQLYHGVVLGSGSYVKDITRSHNQFVERQINRAHQLKGETTGRFNSLKGFEPIFSPELSAGINDEVTNFFNALGDLATNPDDIAIRTAAREAGRNLGVAFQRVDRDLRQRRVDLDDVVKQGVADVNSHLQAISKLNQQIQETEVTPGAFANDLRDQRDLMMRELTEKIEVNYYEDEFGNVCVRGPDDITLVDRGVITELQAVSSESNDGFMDIIAADPNGIHKRNITRKMEGGTLKGVVDVRDNIATDLMTKNNEMAYRMATSFNAIHQTGYGIKDYNETTGRNFFKPVENFEFAARDFDISDELSESIEAISIASSPLAIGDNVVGNQILELKDAKIFENGKTSFIDFYGGMVGGLGIEINRVQHLKEANDVVVADLQAQRESISGVSLDEEAINLMKWQSNFTASSKVITTVDEMIETVLGMKR
ncbi:MAG: flagellar hook-associated protein FlgK [Proteobacteria bacterium]|nr:flagellar hook-associated protein FlgK [Pseudomonadota bacterium]